MLLGFILGCEVYEYTHLLNYYNLHPVRMMIFGNITLTAFIYNFIPIKSSAFFIYYVIILLQDITTLNH